MSFRAPTLDEGTLPQLTAAGKIKTKLHPAMCFSYCMDKPINLEERDPKQSLDSESVVHITMST